MVLVADQTRQDIKFGTNETTKDCSQGQEKKGNPAFLLHVSSSALKYTSIHT